jgi:hypothetical protein
MEIILQHLLVFLLQDFEILLGIIFYERQIKYSPILVQVAALLFLYLKPAEVYHLLSELISNSNESHK